MESHRLPGLRPGSPRVAGAVAGPERPLAKLARRLKPTWVIDYQDDVVTRTSIPGALSKRPSLGADSKAPTVYANSANAPHRRRAGGISPCPIKSAIRVLT